MNTHEPHIVVIGGGLSGLIAATAAANAGARVVLLEKASSLGGRAATRDKNGFLLNLGPHALYRRGELKRRLDALGIDVHGGVPGAAGGYAFFRGQRHTLPTGLSSLITTGLLSVAEKLELARIQTRLPHIDPRPLQSVPLATWLTEAVHHDRVRDLLAMLVRVTTFTNDPAGQSAGAAIEQLQLALRGNVIYVDGGWETIVEGLRRMAVNSGVRIIAGAHAAALERGTEGHVDAVRLADGAVVRAASVVITGSPADVDALTARTQFARTLPAPVRVATLDVALRSLPRPKSAVAFGVDEPMYFSVHSAVARVAPEGGAVIHTSKYLQPHEAAGGEVEAALEHYMDVMQPGWRDVIVSKQFLPNLTVTHCELTVSIGGVSGRPSPLVAGFDNVFIAGDWVGSRGQLSDGAAASAAEAGTAAVRAASSARTPTVAVAS